MLSTNPNEVAPQQRFIFARVFIVIGFIGAGLFSGWLFLYRLIAQLYCFYTAKSTMYRIGCLLIIALFAGISRTEAQPLTTYTNLQNQVMIWDNGILRKVDYLPPTEIRIGRSSIAYLDNSRSFKIYYGGGVRTLNAGFTNAFRTSDNLTIFLNAKSLNVFDRGVVKNLSLLAEEYYLGDSLVVFLDGVRSEYKAYYNGKIYPVESFLAGDALRGIKVSDNIAAYNNYARQFHIFYEGNNITQEEYQARDFEVGRNTVAYLDAGNIFKIFHNGKTITAENFPPVSYTAGDNVVAYISNDGYFKIYYGDSIYNFGYFRPEFQVGDNVVAFRDAGGYFKVFYKGEITQLDSYYPENYIVQYNSLVYLSRARVLRMFSAGEVYDVTSGDFEGMELNYDVLRYRIGENIYRIFYKGEEN